MIPSPLVGEGKDEGANQLAPSPESSPIGDCVVNVILRR